MHLVAASKAMVRSRPALDERNLVSHLARPDGVTSLQESPDLPFRSLPVRHELVST
jgi:hypothetical protein